MPSDTDTHAPSLNQPRMTQKTGVVRNVVANWIGLGLNLAVAFFMSPFLVHRLGDTMYGVWALLLALTGHMGLLDAGLRVSVVRYVSRFSAVSDTPALGRVVSTALSLYGGISLLVVALGVGLAPLLPRLFTIPPAALPTARVVLVITAVNLAISLLTSVFNGVLAGRQRYDHANRIGICLLVVRSVAIVLLVSRGYGILGLGLVHTGAQLLNGLWLVRYAYREVPGLRVGWSGVTRSTVKMLYGYSLFVLLNNIAMILLFSSAEVVVGVFIGAGAITYYAIAGSLLQQLSRLVGMMTQVLHPYASAQEARGDLEGLRRTVVLGTKACMVIALPVTLTLVVVGRTFLRFWMGERYAAVAAPLLIVLAVGRLFWLAQSSTGNVLFGVGRHRFLAVVNLCTGIASITLGSVLAQRMGLFGLALGMTIPIVVAQGLIVPRVAVTVFDIPAADYWRQAYLQPLVATLPYALALVSLHALVDPAGLGELAGVVVLAAPAFVLAAYRVCFSPTERQDLKRGYVRWRTALAGGR